MQISKVVRASPHRLASQTHPPFINVAKLFEKSVEVLVHAQKDMRIALVLDRNGKDTTSKSPVRFETESVVRHCERDLAPGEHSTWNCNPGVFPGVPGCLIRLSIFQPDLEAMEKLQSLPSCA